MGKGQLNACTSSSLLTSKQTMIKRTNKKINCFNAITCQNNQVQMYNNKVMLNSMVDRRQRTLC